MTDGLNTFVAGQTGSGKTELVKRRIQTCDRLIVWQPKPEDVGYPGVYFDCRIPGERETWLRWWQYVEQRCGRWRMVIRPANKFDATEYDRFARLVYTIGNCTVVIEECGSFLKSAMFQAVDRFQAIRDLLTNGRTRGVNAYYVHQRPKGIPVEVKSECREAFLFYLQEEPDRQYVQETFGLEARLILDGITPNTYQHVHWINTGKVEVGKA